MSKGTCRILLFLAVSSVVKTQPHTIQYTVIPRLAFVQHIYRNMQKNA